MGRDVRESRCCGGVAGGVVGVNGGTHGAEVTGGGLGGLEDALGDRALAGAGAVFTGGEEEQVPVGFGDAERVGAAVAECVGEEDGSGLVGRHV